MAAEIESSPQHLNTAGFNAAHSAPGNIKQSLNSMALLSVDDKEIDNIILSLKDKSAVGWDGISTSVIKSARHILIPLLSHLFNIALSSGIFPRAFKRAIVHPVFKSGDRDSVSNYRPISVLTVLSKIFEKVLNSRLVSFLIRKAFSLIISLVLGVVDLLMMLF